MHYLYCHRNTRSSDSSTWRTLTWVSHLSGNCPGPVHLQCLHYHRQTPGHQTAPAHPEINSVHEEAIEFLHNLIWLCVLVYRTQCSQSGVKHVNKVYLLSFCESVYFKLRHCWLVWYVCVVCACVCACMHACVCARACVRVHVQYICLTWSCKVLCAHPC